MSEASLWQKPEARSQKPEARGQRSEVRWQLAVGSWQLAVGGWRLNDYLGISPGRQVIDCLGNFFRLGFDTGP